VLATIAEDEGDEGAPAGDLKHWTNQTVHTDFFDNAG